MRNEALFLNGVYADVLEEIVQVQTHLPEQILFLQPYSGKPIAHLASDPPSVDDPVRLLVSVTDDLVHVHYMGEIVGWDDKRMLGPERRHLLEQIVHSLQRVEEVGVYAESRGIECVNLLHVRRLRKLFTPFSVAELTVNSTGRPHSTGRATAGGWSYVANPNNAWIEAYL